MTGPHHEQRPGRSARSFVYGDDRNRVRKPEGRRSEQFTDVPAPEGPAEVLDEASVSMFASLPRHTAMLYVAKQHTKMPGNHIRLVFHLGGEREESESTECFPQEAIARLGVASIVERGTWRTDHDLLISYWPTMKRLAMWMRRLLDEEPAARLVVWDDTTFQIPWELYHLHDRGAGQKPVWLGSVREIVRWSSHLQETPDVRYTVPQTTCKGSMLLMEAPDIGSHLTHLAAGFGLPAVQTMDDLMAKLATETLRFAMMMVHSHSENATHADEFLLAGMAFTKLARMPMPALERSRAVVVLNACNTAKAVSLTAGAHMPSKSFAELFLRNGASAVIATLSQVSIDHTYDFVAHVVEDDESDPRLAGLLRSWRRRHVKQIEENPDDSGAYMDFFYAFAYVCFGHPDTSLQLIGGEAA